MSAIDNTRARLRAIAPQLPEIARLLVAVLKRPDRDNGDHALVAIEKLMPYDDAGFYDRILPVLFADIEALAREPAPPPEPVSPCFTFHPGVQVRLFPSGSASGETRSAIMRLGLIATPVRVNASGVPWAPELPRGGADDCPRVEFRGYNGRQAWIPLAHLRVLPA